MTFRAPGCLSARAEQASHYTPAMAGITFDSRSSFGHSIAVRRVAVHNTGGNSTQRVTMPPEQRIEPKFLRGRGTT